MRCEHPISQQDIEKIARNLLREAKALRVFPTPVAKITQTAELLVDRGVDLSTIDPGYFVVGKEALQGALRKLLGAIDLRKRVIYVDAGLSLPRRNFVELHEVGHSVLPWQRAVRVGYGDDDLSLDPEVNEEFEREASFFASAVLFQGEHFDEEAKQLPLEFSSIQFLAKRFGASIQATARRYVTRSLARCALLVLHKPSRNSSGVEIEVRNCFESPGFLKAFGQLALPEKCGEEYEFVSDVKRGRRMRIDGLQVLKTEHQGTLVAKYHFFHNTYNYFVLLFPPDEKITSKITLVVQGLPALSRQNR